MSSYQIIGPTYALYTSGDDTASLEITTGFSMNGSRNPTFFQVLNTSLQPIQIFIDVTGDGPWPTGLPTSGNPQPGITVPPNWPMVFQVSETNQDSTNAFMIMYAPVEATVYVTQIHY